MNRKDHRKRYGLLSISEMVKETIAIDNFTGWGSSTWLTDHLDAIPADRQNKWPAPVRKCHILLNITFLVSSNSKYH
jgi:hypothetical protein